MSLESVIKEAAAGARKAPLSAEEIAERARVDARINERLATTRQDVILASWREAAVEAGIPIRK